MTKTNNLNELGKENYEESKKAFKKPIEVDIGEPFKETTIVETLEGKVEAPKGYRMVTGVKGEKYPIGEDVFNQYRKLDNGKYAKEKVVISYLKLKEEGSVKTPWGAILNAKVGDYLIMESKENMWVVEESIFDETYEVLDN